MPAVLSDMPVSYFINPIDNRDDFVFQAWIAVNSSDQAPDKITRAVS